MYRQPRTFYRSRRDQIEGILQPNNPIEWQNPCELENTKLCHLCRDALSIKSKSTGKIIVVSRHALPMAWHASYFWKIFVLYSMQSIDIFTKFRWQVKPWMAFIALTSKYTFQAVIATQLNVGDLFLQDSVSSLCFLFFLTPKTITNK